MKLDERMRMIEDFKKFRDSAEETFKGFQRNGSSQKFDDRYMLNVCPKGRNGGMSERLCEVFYGGALYDKEVKVNKNFQRTEYFLTETGATLAFNLLDDGNVLVMLHLPFTERMKPLISSIVLEFHIDPKKLTKWRLKSYWRKLNLSMEVHSLIGSKTWYQRLIWSVWQMFQNTIIDGQLQEKKICKILKRILEYTLTVGFSGFLIYVFTIFPSKTTPKSDQILEQILEQSKIENNNTDSVLMKLDSLVKERRAIQIQP